MQKPWMPFLEFLPNELVNEIEEYVENPKKYLHDALTIYFYLIRTSMKQKYIHKRCRLGIDSPITIPLLRIYDLTEQRWCLEV